MTKSLVVFFFIAAAITSVSNRCDAQVVFNFDSVGSAEADNALRLAADRWSAQFSDNITVNLDFSFADLGVGAVSGATSSTQTSTFAGFRDALGSDIMSDSDLTFQSSLPTGATFSPYINRTSEAGGPSGADPYVDDDGGANNSTVVLTTANAKAIGLRAGDDAGLDGSIVFNSLPWDFDPSDGITPGTLDFVGVATHEIGHTLGFESGVDEIDSLFSLGGIGSIGGGVALPDDNELVVTTALDFLRFSEDSVDNFADIDITADNRNKFLSIDGGLTDLIGGGDHFSTGINFGDGEEASHYREGIGLGVFDPNAAAGESVAISGLDVQVLDVIGFDVAATAVPEPSMLAPLFLGLTACLIRRRGKRS